MSGCKQQTQSLLFGLSNDINIQGKFLPKNLASFRTMGETRMSFKCAFQCSHWNIRSNATILFECDLNQSRSNFSANNDVKDHLFRRMHIKRVLNVFSFLLEIRSHIRDNQVIIHHIISSHIHRANCEYTMQCVLQFRANSL